MAEIDKKSIKDGFRVFSAGVDSGNESTDILPNQVHWAENVTFRGGYPETRPGFRGLTFVYDNTEIETWFKTGLFQGYGEYSPLHGGDHYFMFSVGGRIFKGEIDERTITITELTPFTIVTTTSAFVSPPIGSNVTVAFSSVNGLITGFPVIIGDTRYEVVSKTNLNVVLQSIAGDSGISVASGTSIFYMDANSSNTPIAWFQQIGKWMVIQNNLDAAMLYDGSKIRRSNYATSKEVPTGSVMGVYRGRLWLAINERYFIAGDVDGGPNEPIKFTENTYLDGGGAFRVPPGHGSIRSMSTLASLDSALGEGPLIVGTTKGAFTVNAPPTRDQWSNVTDPIQTPSITSYGPVSHYSTVNVNGDLFYRAVDGVRTLAMARRDFGEWANVPISAEMQRAMKGDDEALISYSSAILFDNRYLFTTVSRSLNNGNSAYFEAIGALDFNAVSRMIQRPTPIWEGIWTGLKTRMLLKGTFQNKERGFAVILDENNENTIWEITKDYDFDGNDGRICSVVEFRTMEFRNPYELKSNEQFNLWTDRIVGTVDYTLKYRPDQYPCWFAWGNSKSICSQYKECNSSVCDSPKNFNPGYRTRLRWAEPSEVDETFDNKPARLFYELNTRLEWVGHARVKKIIAKARMEQEEPHAGDLD